jgi:hypothetical protein
VSLLAALHGELSSFRCIGQSENPGTVHGHSGQTVTPYFLFSYSLPLQLLNKTDLFDGSAIGLMLK